MVLASSITSILSMLLLLLILFHQGLQGPVRCSDTCHLPSGTTSTENCSLLVKEIMAKLPEYKLTQDDFRTQLRNETLQRVNLCEFLKMQRKVDPKDVPGIRPNLEKLECCLSAPVDTSTMIGIFIEENLTDFQQKLRFYVNHLNNLQLVPNPRPPHPTCDSVTSRPVTMQC